MDTECAFSIVQSMNDDKKMEVADMLQQMINENAKHNHLNKESMFWNSFKSNFSCSLVIVFLGTSFFKFFLQFLKFCIIGFFGALKLQLDSFVLFSKLFDYRLSLNFQCYLVDY